MAATEANVDYKDEPEDDGHAKLLAKFEALNAKMRKKAKEDHKQRVVVEQDQESERHKYMMHCYESEIFNGFWVYDAKSNNRKVLFDGKIQNIHSINLKEDTFEAMFKFYLTWVATDEDIQSFLSLPKEKEKTWSPKWVPKMEVTNAETDLNLSKTVKYKLRHGAQYDWVNIWDSFDPYAAYWVRAEYQVQGIFIEEYELHAFPFDCQDLTLRLKHKGNYKDHIVFAPFPRTGPWLNFYTHLSELQDFIVCNLMVEFGTTKKNRSKRGDTFPAIVISVKVARRFRSQLSKMFLVLAVCGMSMGVFAIDSAASGDRMNYLITLILTDVALQQSIRDKLDDFPYETFMDKIILAGFTFKLLVLVWVMIASSPSISVQLDQILALVAGGCLLLFYLLVVLFAYILRGRENDKLAKTVGELEEFYEEQDPVTAPVQIVLEHVEAALECNSNMQMAVFGKKLGKKAQEKSVYFPLHLEEYL